MAIYIGRCIASTQHGQRMTLQMPCSGAGECKIDMRVSVCRELPLGPLRGALGGDMSCKVDGDPEDACVLTMASPWCHDDQLFFKQKIAWLESDGFAIETKLMQHAAWKTLTPLLDKAQDVGCLAMVGCGHRFSGLPLLYLFMCNGFKCPVCRFGGNKQVDIAAIPAPVGICAHTWTALCVIAQVVRSRDSLEHKEDEMRMSIQLARQAISAVYASLPWVMRFVLYKESAPGMGSAPFAEVPMRLCVDKESVQAQGEDWSNRIQMRAGARALIVPSCVCTVSVLFVLVLSLPEIKTDYFNGSQCIWMQARCKHQIPSIPHQTHVIMALMAQNSGLCCTNAK